MVNSITFYLKCSFFQPQKNLPQKKYLEKLDPIRSNSIYALRCCFFHQPFRIIPSIPSSTKAPEAPREMPLYTWSVPSWMVAPLVRAAASHQAWDREGVPRLVEGPLRMGRKSSHPLYNRESAYNG